MKMLLVQLGTMLTWFCGMLVEQAHGGWPYKQENQPYGYALLPDGP